MMSARASEFCHLDDTTGPPKAGGAMGWCVEPSTLMRRGRVARGSATTVFG